MAVYSLPQLWQRSRQRRDKHFDFYVAPKEEVARSYVWRSRRVDFCGLRWKQVVSCSYHTQTTEILGWLVPCETVCEMHFAQLLRTLSSSIAEHTTPLLWSIHFQN
jgi:hypothetical protein